MFIRLERVPVYERHLLFCSDLDERSTPCEIAPVIVMPPEVSVGDQGPRPSSIARVPLKRRIVRRWLN